MRKMDKWTKKIQQEEERLKNIYEAFVESNKRLKSERVRREPNE